MERNIQEYEQLTRAERDLIYTMRSSGGKIREIGRALRRSASTISRELGGRNRHLFPVVERRMTALEKSAYAQAKAVSRRKIPRKNKKLSCDAELRQEVVRLLDLEEASPRDISFRIADKFPGKSLSYTTVYNFTKYERPDLRAKHRLRGKSRRQRLTPRRSKVKEGALAKRNINQRPEVIARRLEYGHYESDTIHSLRNGSGFAILSLRELKSRMRWYFLLGDLKAETTLAILQGFFRLLPAHMRRSLTVDNGGEFAILPKLEQTFPGMQIYYCDPYCAWQRGASENCNGEFRWYFPKGTDFKNIPLQNIWATQDKINRRHMVVLGGRSAQNVFQQALKGPITREMLAIGSRSNADEEYFEQMILPFPPSCSMALPEILHSRENLDRQLLA